MATIRRPSLIKAPTCLRSSISKGILSAELPPVEEQGGDAGAGLVRGFSAICRGEALGHDLWIDNDFLQQTTDAINASASGAKSRFTHPGLSGDGLARFLGRTKGATLDGDAVRADQHFAASAHDTPDGDLAGYVMRRAKEDPASFGASISFEHDPDAECAFLMANGWTPPNEDEEDDDDPSVFAARGFVSPDPLNVKNLPHARLKTLKAVDIVDDPASNPTGLFHRGDEIAAEASDFAAYVLGVSKKKPTLSNFDIDPDRAAGFVQRFLSQHGLALVPKKEPTMSTEPKTLVAEAGTTVVLTAEQSAALEAAGKTPKPKKTGKDFIDAFGTQGAVWFAEGVSFVKAKELHAKAMADELKAEKKRSAELLDALTKATGEATPLSFNGERSPTELLGERAQQRFRNLPPKVAQFAAGIVMPATAVAHAKR